LDVELINSCSLDVTSLGWM